MSAPTTRRVVVAVIGPSRVSQSSILDAAESLGRALAEAGYVVLTGATTGVMQAASHGAASAGGLTVGITPSDNPDEANEHVGVAIASGFGEGRNILIVNSARALVVVGKSHGTLAEVALALRAGKPVVSLHSYGSEIDPAIRRASSVEEAIANIQACVSTEPRA